MINKEVHQGYYTIVCSDEDSIVIQNRVMNTVLSSMIGVLKGDTADLEIKYLATGTSDVAVTDTDTQLGAEIFRTPITVGPIDVGVGHIEHRFSILDTESVGLIKEIGIFGGSTASITPNSGVLLSRVLWTKNKTNSIEITITRVDKVVRG